MSTDAQTQAFPRVSATVSAAAEAEIAAPQPDVQAAAPGRDTEGAGEEPIQQVYEAAMARLHALHDRWTAAVVELCEAQVDSEPSEAAA